MQTFYRDLWRKLAGPLGGTALVCAVLAASLASAADQSPALGHLGVGATFDTLQVGKLAYQHVQVRSVNARSLMIVHAGGLASVRLRDLAPELQAAFGYNPEAEAAADAALKSAQLQAEQKRPKDAPPKSGPAGAKRSSGSAPFDALLQSFGQPPEIRAGVDLRPQFIALALNVKNQGPRPSCAVFAIVSALEFQNAQLVGQPERFSEEYLVWATCKTLNRAPRAPAASEPDNAGADADNTEKLDSADEGFALAEVVTALRAFGIPLQTSLPYSFSKTPAADPPSEVIEEARRHQRVSVVALPGRDEATKIANLVQALDAGVPVAVGLRWPAWRALRSGFLDQQKPLESNGHAVTVVGYENKTGAIKDSVFIFKNSWGVKWGAGGYGYATYDYFLHNLVDTALLEVGPGDPAKPSRP